MQKLHYCIPSLSCSTGMLFHNERHKGLQYSLDNYSVKFFTFEIQSCREFAELRAHAAHGISIVKFYLFCTSRPTLT